MTRIRGSKNKHTLKEEKEGLRTCNLCEKPKALTEFYSNGKYLMRSCKLCDNTIKNKQQIRRSVKITKNTPKTLDSTCQSGIMGV